MSMNRIKAKLILEFETEAEFELPPEEWHGQYETLGSDYADQLIKQHFPNARIVYTHACIIEPSSDDREKAVDAYLDAKEGKR